MNSKIIPIVDGTKLFATAQTFSPGVPAFVRLVLVCIAVDTSSGLTPGQEIDTAILYSVPNAEPAFSAVAASQNISITYDGTIGTAFRFPSIGLALRLFSSLNNFKLKVYWGDDA